MKNIKNLNIINFALEIVICILTFIDGIYHFSHTGYTKGSEMSLFNTISNYSDRINSLFGVLFIVGFIIMIIVFFLQLSSKKNYKISFFVSLLQFVFFIAHSIELFNSTIVTDAGTTGAFTAGQLYYVALIIIIAICIISIVSYIYSKKILVSSINNLNQISDTITKVDADELKKYKDLLDSGVITQEEFDAKKKQVLGL